MADIELIRNTIDRIVEEVVKEQSLAIRDSVRQRIVEELGSELGSAPGAAPTDILNAAVATIQEGAVQTEILKSLLDGASQFSNRCALLVVRGSTATGWQARGFVDNESIRSYSCNCSGGLSGRVLQNRQAAGASADEFDATFIQRFGRPDGNVVLLPLVIKEKVAALVYADAGAEGSASGLDRSALEILVRVTGMWLEVLSVRKMAPAEHPANADSAQAVAQAASAPMPSEPVPAGAIEAVSTANPKGFAGEDEVHNKARRFAKLLVEEIKLYNQGKVGEGRASRDLYDRLKDDIDKSRATYDKRYGQSISDVDYFTQELVRILADNDRSVLGRNFRW